MQKGRVRMGRAQNGNILFLILLAVALFAALAYAVTSSLRGGGKDASSEKTRLFAAQLIENASLIEQTMMRAMLVDNVPEYGFDFYNGGSGSSNSASNASCTQAACKIYAPNGGHVPYLTIPDWASMEASPASLNRRPYTYVTQVMDIGSPAPDVIVLYQYLNLDLCRAINALLGHGDTPMTPDDTLSGVDYNYGGTLTVMPASTGVIGDTNPALRGRKSACYRISENIYRFHYVILER